MDTTSIVEQLRGRLDQVNTAIRALERVGTSSPRKGRQSGRRTMSAEARARIGAAMRKAWARRKATQR